MNIQSRLFLFGIKAVPNRKSGKESEQARHHEASFVYVLPKLTNCDYLTATSERIEIFQQRFCLVL